MFPFNELMDFKIEMTDEHELFRKSLREFAENRVRPYVQKVEETNEIPQTIIDGARELGLFGVGIPQEYGGQGGDMRTMAIMAEELSRVMPSLGTMVFVNHLFIDPVLMFGTEEQKRKYIPRIAKGEIFAAHANTEAAAGSDVAGIKTKAERTEGGYIINGRKIFITNSDRASVFILSARTNPPEPGKRWKGITTFIAEKGMKGLEIGQKFKVIGLRGEQPNEVIFDNLFVPDSNIVGKPDEGFKVIVTTYDYSRILIAAQAVGIAQAAFELAFNYSTERIAFEKPLISFEGVAFKISDMLTKLETARLLVYWAAYMADQKKPLFLMASSMAKAYATETAEELANLAIKIHGGAGVDQGTGVERYLRDSIITTIYEGANDIQRLTIAKTLLKLVSKSAEIG
ncbi:MAG: acyl-CoA dehydrogenase family protein [Nitrososphaeria archaeon]|nr:acyl-CoA dehydrogenase family protein [Conexivisphaerales archaeon]